MNEILEQFNDQNAQSTFNPEEVQKNNILTAVCYFPLLFFLPLLVDKNSSYCRFHANQALIWFVFIVIFSLFMAVISFIPVLGAIIDVLVGLALLAVTICLMVGAYKGMALRLPFIGSINLIN